MSQITPFMTDDHRRCDDYFAQAEAAAAAGDLPTCQRHFQEFSAALLQHFAMEEQVLFPAFEEKTGMRMGPTRVMLMEHAQMRDLLTALQDALTAGDADEYLGQAETMMILMQQHNMKEEQMLYPMSDRALSGSDILSAMQSCGHSQ